MPVTIEVRLHGGGRHETTAILRTEFNVPGPHHRSLVLPSAHKDQVPIGRELWLVT